MTDHLTHVPAPDGLAPSPQYSHVVWGTGRFVAVSGQCALDATGAVVGEGDAAAQGVSCRSGRIRERRLVPWIARRRREAGRSPGE